MKKRVYIAILITFALLISRCGEQNRTSTHYVYSGPGTGVGSQNESHKDRTLIFITNSYCVESDCDPAPNEDFIFTKNNGDIIKQTSKYHNYKTFTKGPPHATEVYTAEELSTRGFIGWYVENWELDSVPLLKEHIYKNGKLVY